LAPRVGIEPTTNETGDIAPVLSTHVETELSDIADWLDGLTATEEEDS
jgi:hypothetical protein